jgi:hypothetical protein
MAREQNEPLLFIDANIFLKLYAGIYSVDLAALLAAVRRERARLITNDQLLVEVLKHRGEVLSGRIKKLNLDDPPNHFMSDGSRAATKAHTAKIRKHLDTAKRKAERVLKHPARHDPIFKLLADLLKSGGDLCLRTEDPLFAEVFLRAERRFLLNRPPVSKQDSCGDSLHWEWMVYCAQQQRRDVTIVTLDADFSEDYLPLEFKRRTKRRLTVKQNITEALTVTQKAARAYEAAVREAQEDFAGVPIPQPTTGVTTQLASAMTTLGASSDQLKRALLSSYHVDLAPLRDALAWKFSPDVEAALTGKFSPDIEAARQMVASAAKMSDEVREILAWRPPPQEESTKRALQQLIEETNRNRAQFLDAIRLALGYGPTTTLQSAAPPIAAPLESHEREGRAAGKPPDSTSVG